MMWSIFQCTYLIFKCYLWSICQPIWPFLKIGLFSYYWLLEVLFVYSGCKSSVRYMICNYFLSDYSLSFHSLNSVFDFDEAQFKNIFYILPDYLYFVSITDFYMSIFYPTTSLNLLIRFNRFFGKVFRIFYIQDHIICKQRQFKFFLSDSDAFYFFFLPDCSG